MNEQDYLKGSRRAYTDMLRHCLKELGISGQDNPETKIAKLELEREETIAMLRQVCERFGDNEWEANLYLPDIIEKHLWRNLESAET